MKKPRLIYIFLIVLLCSLLPVGMKGQNYRMEVGFLGGNSFYMGDANQNRLFANAQTSYGALVRYNLDRRFVIKGNALFAGISGSTIGEASTFINGADLKFNHTVFDAGVQLEMNFFEYGAPAYQPSSSRLSPYILFGVGLTGYNAGGQKVCANIPFGLGLKAKVLPRINLGCEWTFRKTYTDALDYVNTSADFQLNDPWSGASSRNKNKDWYSILMVYVTYDIYGIGSKCFK